jgi:dihydropteroate synthase
MASIHLLQHAPRLEQSRCTRPSPMKPILEARGELDRKLSQRFIALDPGGYFIIYLEPEQDLICAKHYSNIINDKGLAVDPETGKPIPVRGKVDRLPTALFTGRTAKELGIKIFEQPDGCPVTQLDHAAYLGREFQRAEFCLQQGEDYIQD